MCEDLRDKNVGRGDIEAGTPKCNIFVYDKLIEAGAKVPLVETSRNPFNDELHPPLARQWADPDFEIEGWEVVDAPQPGDVASYMGHVGIVSGEGVTISASDIDDKVVENDWGFRPGQQGNVIFRRYVGK